MVVYVFLLYQLYQVILKNIDQGLVPKLTPFMMPDGAFTVIPTLLFKVLEKLKSDGLVIEGGKITINVLSRRAMMWFANRVLADKAVATVCAKAALPDSPEGMVIETPPMVTAPPFELS